MRNVTITLNEEILQWARVWAAKNNSSVSRLVGEILNQRMKEEKGYEMAMKQYLSRTPKLLKREGKYPSRDELHERSHLR